MRAKDTHWPKVEETFKQLDTAEKELECFRALQKQEQLAASHRINNLWEEVQKQKELERTLQKRYGGLLEEVERVQPLRERCIAEEQEKEVAAKNDLELADAAADVTVALSTTTLEPTNASASESTDLQVVDGMHVDAEKKEDTPVTTDDASQDISTSAEGSVSIEDPVSGSVADVVPTDSLSSTTVADDQVVGA